MERYCYAEEKTPKFYSRAFLSFEVCIKKKKVGLDFLSVIFFVQPLPIKNVLIRNRLIEELS